MSPTMNDESESERRERSKRGAFLASVHDDIPKRVGRAIVAAEQGWSHSGIAKLSDIDVTQNTVRKWLDSVVDTYGVEAVFAKQPEERKGPIGPSDTIQNTMPYEPDALESQAQNDEQTSFSGKIVSIEDTTAGEVFGDDANNPDRELIECEVVVKVPGGDDMVFTDTYSLPKGPQSWHNPNFALGKFHDYYEELPREGSTVEVEYNDDGFLRIVTGE